MPTLVRGFVIGVLGLLAAFTLGLSPAKAKDKTITYRKGDPEMAVAIAKARETLPEFWAMLKAPQPGVGKFALKVAISEPGNEYTEHFWLNAIERQNDDKITGTINNEPNHIKSVKLGQRYPFAKDQISDWMFYRNGKIVGGWTIRPMLKRLPKAQADALRKTLEKP